MGCGPAPKPRKPKKLGDNQYVSNGDKVTLTERIDYLGGDSDTYTVEGAGRKFAYFVNDRTGGRSSLPTWQIKQALADGRIKPVQADVEDGVKPSKPAETTAPIEDFGEKLEGAPQVRAGFDDFFRTIETEQTDKGVRLKEETDAYSPAGDEALYSPDERRRVQEDRGGEDPADRDNAADAQPVGRPGIERALLPPEQGSIRGLGIARVLERHGSAALVGRTAETPGELAELAQIYRDPRYETLRVFFTKGNEIVHATGVSSRTTREAPLLPGDYSPADFSKWLNERMGESGADGYYLLHNHPSGRPDPSQADRDVTRLIAETSPGFRGHVIINSGKYAVVNGSGASKLRDLQGAGPDKLLQPAPGATHRARDRAAPGRQPRAA
jgi:hypothetical protein